MSRSSQFEIETAEQEEAFFEWWEKIAPNKDQYNLRMAFDAGYKAGKEVDRD